MRLSLNRPRLFLLLSLLTFAAHGISLRNGFVWDDDLLIAGNPRIRNFTCLPTAFLTDLFQDYSTRTATHYRPLQTVSYMADYFWSGLHPFGYHLTNLLLHLLCVLLLAQLILTLTGNFRWALGAAALWAVHPAHTNAIAYVAGRADPLALAGMLAALLAVHRYRRTGRWPAFLGAAVATTLALLARENALLLPALVALMTYYFHDRRWAAALAAGLPFAMLAAAFVAWRQLVLATAPTVSLNLLAALSALATYAGILIWPAHLQMERAAGNPHGVTGALVLAGLVAGTAWSHRRQPVVAFGLTWFLVTLTPVLGWLTLNAPVAEHWLYLPSAGLFLAVAAVLPARRWVTVAGMVVLAGLIVRANFRNRDWYRPVTFYQQTLAAAPGSARAWHNLASEQARAGQLDTALVTVERAIAADPGNPRARITQAWIHWQAGNLAAAQAAIEAALALDPENASAWLRAAGIAESAGQWREAERAYLRAMTGTTSQDPRLLYAHFLLRRQRYREALSVAEDIIALEPGHVSGHNLRGAALAALGRRAEAAAAFERARRLDRHSRAAEQNLRRLAGAGG